MPVVYFFRHGETDFNVVHRLQGRYETGINAKGRQQAAVCAGLLSDLFARDGRGAAEFCYVSSPLRRARQTMELVRADLGLDRDAYGVDDRLAEISYGAWEGLTLAEVGAREPAMLEQRDRDKWDFAPPGGESYRDVAVRVGEWYAAVTRDTVVAAHGGVARVLMADLGIVPQDEAPYADVRHGVVYVFAGGAMSCYA